MSLQERDLVNGKFDSLSKLSGLIKFLPDRKKQAFSRKEERISDEDLVFSLII